MYGLIGFRHDLLYVIVGLNEPRGPVIKDQLEDYYEAKIHHGRLYPNFGTLAEKGLPGKGEKDHRANVYTITARGRRKIEARDDWEQQYTNGLIT